MAGCAASLTMRCWAAVWDMLCLQLRIAQGGEASVSAAACMRLVVLGWGWLCALCCCVFTVRQVTELAEWDFRISTRRGSLGARRGCGTLTGEVMLTDRRRDGWGMGRGV